VLVAGVAKGLERANVIFIPLLVVGFGILVVRSLTLPGATDGLDALFTPNWAALGDADVWIAAYAQIFFSLSVAFGIMITYSSYRRRRANLTSPGLVVAFANSSFEILAGIGVFAALGFLAHQQSVAVGDIEGLTGPILSFVTFPTIVSQMPAGPLFGCLFFGSLAIAGFTSFISILQVVSAAFQEKFGLSRRQAPVRIGIVAAVLSIVGMGTTTGLVALDTIDNWANNVGIVASAVLTCILVVWVLRQAPLLRAHLNAVSTTQVGPWWYACVGVVVPFVLAFMLVSRIVSLVTEGYEGYATWYLNVFGWGMIGVLVVGAFVFARIRWRVDPDVFEPWPMIGATTGGAARGADERRPGATDAGKEGRR